MTSVINIPVAIAIITIPVERTPILRTENMLSLMPINMIPSLRSFFKPKPTPGWQSLGTPTVFLTIIPRTIAIIMALTGLFASPRRVATHFVNCIPTMVTATARASPGIMFKTFCVPNRISRILFLLTCFPPYSLDRLASTIPLNAPHSRSITISLYMRSRATFSGDLSSQPQRQL